MNEVATLPVPKPMLRAGGGISAIVPQTLEEAFRLAEAICVAGLVPDSLRGKTDRETASRVMITILRGQEVGLPPMAALANIYIINNKPSMYGDGALAVVQKHPAYVGHKEWAEGIEGQDSWVSKCEFYRKEADGSITTYPGQFSWAQAKTAGLTRRGPWVSYPGRMLKMRARAFGMRDGFSDALVGISIAEEVQDVPQKPTEVLTTFLDVAADAPSADVLNDSPVETESPATAVLPVTAPAVDTTPIAEPPPQEVLPPQIDSKALLQSIKKNFIQAGGDKALIGQVIAAAEGLQLDEACAAELAAIIKAKKERVG